VWDWDHYMQLLTTRASIPKNGTSKGRAMSLEGARALEVVTPDDKPAAQVHAPKDAQPPAVVKRTNHSSAAVTSAPAAASGSSMAAVPTVAEPAPVEASDAPASLSLKDEAYSEKVGDQPDEEHSKVELPGATLTNEEIFRIVREVARADSGDAMYSAIS